MQTCNKCSVVKPFTEFYVENQRGKKYVRKVCKVCEKSRSAQYVRDNRVARVEYNRDYLRRNPEKVSKYNRREQLKKYGLDSQSYAARLAEQCGGCAICGSPPAEKNLHVDHDHITGDVRAILCDTCNRGLGYFQDQPELLTIAAAYLYSHKKVMK